MSSAAIKTEFGDFQTPLALAGDVCALLASMGVCPQSVLEPTCGFGTFLLAAIEQFKLAGTFIGFDINGDYVSRASAAISSTRRGANTCVTQASFFDIDWDAEVARLAEPVLLLGNPPWVTNSTLGSLGSPNLPVKSNFQKHAGLDAKMGKANFDISEWMILRLVEAMKGRSGTLAMLCKSAVARKVLTQAWKDSASIGRCQIRRIDAKRHFDAAVDAVLLVIHFIAGKGETTANVFDDLRDGASASTIGYIDDQLIADVSGYLQNKHLAGTSHLQWRSGIKHDCSRVMELKRQENVFWNGMGEQVCIERDYLFPMLKSSDVARDGKSNSDRWMIVPQRRVNEDTNLLKRIAPLLWKYLTDHEEFLDRRASSIYRNRPRFSVFGVGEYSFSPWKVAISGFYKTLEFVSIGPVEDRPVVLDDTSYFLSFASREQADFVLSLLNSPVSRKFYSSFVFWDTKRPVTIDLLRKLDLRRLASELGCDDEWNSLFSAQQPPKHGTHERQLELWNA